MIEHNLKIENTSFLFWVIVVIVLLQNGPLNNLPITLLLLLIPALKGFILYKPGQCERFILIYGIYLLLITLWNIGDNFDLKYTINIMIQYLIIYMSIKLTLVKINSGKLLVYLRNFGFVISVLCLVEAVCRNHIWALLLGKKLAEGSERVVGIFNHPIVCAGFLLITLILTIVFPLRKKEAQIIAVTGTVSAIVLTQSRSVWIATVLVLLIYLLKFHTRRMNRTYFVYGMLVIGLILTISIALRYNIVGEIAGFVRTRIRGSLEAGEGHIIRIEIILNSFAYWKNHIGSFLLGRGKNYGLLYLKNNPIVKFGTFIWDAAIDNQYITLVHETGIIGLIMVLSVIATAFNRFVKSDRNDKIQIAASLCLVGNAICLFFYEGFNYPVMMLFYMIFILLSDSQKSWSADKESGILEKR